MTKAVIVLALISFQPWFPQGDWAVARQLSTAFLHERPADVRKDWKGLIGDYTSGADTVSIMEDGGKLNLLGRSSRLHRLDPVARDRFSIIPPWSQSASTCVIKRNAAGFGASVTIQATEFSRIFYGGESGVSFRIKPLKPASLLRREAMKSSPPKEEENFLKPDLVELIRLDSTIHLDVRYATTNNFMGEKFYSQARAFLQRPAALALVKAHRALRSLGYGLLVHDAYRPWYVTKMFWDATPNGQKEFVADPAKGSRHNRGCAVDLTLYSLKTGKPVDMVSGYDEFSHRAYPHYRGGTSLQRWHRELLRRAMEAQGFTVFESEWWHFDYKDWRSYPIGTLTFEEIH